MLLIAAPVVAAVALIVAITLEERRYSRFAVRLAQWAVLLACMTESALAGSGPFHAWWEIALRVPVAVLWGAFTARALIALDRLSREVSNEPARLARHLAAHRISARRRTSARSITRTGSRAARASKEDS